MRIGADVAYVPDPLGYGKGRIVYSLGNGKVMVWFPKRGVYGNHERCEEYDLVYWDAFLDGGIPVLDDDDFTALTG